MRDGRFDLEEYGSGARRQAIEEGRRVMDEPWASAATAILAAWCRASIQGVDAARAAAEEFVLIPDQAVHDALAAIGAMPPDRVMALGEWTPYPAETEDPAADWIWGVALAEAGVALAPAFDAVSSTWRTAGQQGVTGTAYLTRIADALRGDRRSVIESLLRDIAERIRTLQGCDARRGEREPFAAALDAWRKDAQLSAVWNLRRIEQYAVSCDDVWLLDAARRADRGLFLELLDITDNPVAATRALTRPEVVEDEAEILALLAVAPAIQERSDGGTVSRAWNGRLGAPLLLESLLDHWRLLDRLLLHDYRVPVPRPEVVEALRQDVSGGMDRAVAVLLAREDGIALTCTWALHLARVIAHMPWSTPLVVEDIALHTIARALNEHGIDEEMLRRESGLDADNATGLDLLLVLLAMAHEHVFAKTGTVTPDAALRPGDEHLMGLFIQCLQQGDPDLSLYRDKNPPSLAHVYAAFLIVWSPDTVQTWHSIWNRLAEQRRMMFYRRYDPDSVVDDPSLFVLYTGIAALEWLASDQNVRGTVVPLQLWDRLLDSVLAIVLRLGPFHRRWTRVDAWRNVVILLAALLPHLLRSLPEQGRGDMRVRALLHRLGGDDELIVQCVAFLHRNGMMAGELHTALSGAAIDLDATMRRYGDASGETGRPLAVGGQPSVLDDCRVVLRDAESASAPLISSMTDRTGA